MANDESMGDAFIAEVQYRYRRIIRKTFKWLKVHQKDDEYKVMQMCESTHGQKQG
jgi:hypothetical protein